jgi:hypothetical protein
VWMGAGSGSRDGAAPTSAAATGMAADTGSSTAGGAMAQPPQLQRRPLDVSDRPLLCRDLPPKPLSNEQKDAGLYMCDGPVVSLAIFSGDGASGLALDKLSSAPRGKHTHSNSYLYVTFMLWLQGHARQGCIEGARWVGVTPSCCRPV